LFLIHLANWKSLLQFSVLVKKYEILDLSTLMC